MTQYRQGDVFIERVDSAPTKATEVPREGGAVVLAHGEVTGHTHRLTDPGVCLLQASTGERYLTVAGELSALLVHEEHTAIALPPGTYRVSIQREYDWETEASRNAAD